MCQLCAEKGIEKEATHFCRACASSTDVSLFCASCDAVEHSSRTARTHARTPISQLPFPLCSKHNGLYEDSYCFDQKCEKYICYRCRDDEHQGHKTKLVIEYEKETKNQLRAG